MDFKVSAANFRDPNNNDEYEFVSKIVFFCLFWLSSLTMFRLHLHVVAFELHFVASHILPLAFPIFGEKFPFPAYSCFRIAANNGEEIILRKNNFSESQICLLSHPNSSRLKVKKLVSTCALKSFLGGILKVKTKKAE